MESSDKILRVEREKVVSKTCKLIYITGLIVIVIMMAFYHHNNSDNYLLLQPPPILYTNIQKKKISHQKISGNMIRIVSLKPTPVQKIVIIDHNRQVIPLITHKSDMKKLPDGRYVIEYKIKNTIVISQIIVDIDMSDKKSLNILNTKVEIVNNNIISWTFDDTLSYKRYNTVYVCEPKPDNILKHDLFYNPLASKYDEEIKLSQSLLSQ
jgi:hypothetical protein